MSIDFEYLSKIRTAFSLQTNKKTSNILEGDFRSVYRGRSMEFDELSEYTQGDDVHDIDWKSSSRTGQVLVRRYVAERKHYILFIAETGNKMTADTSAFESKTEVACATLGTAAYLIDRAGADYTLLRAAEESVEYDLFRSGMPHLEKMLHEYRTRIDDASSLSAADLLDYATENIRKRMILFLITDFDGLSTLNERLIQKVVDRNDLLVVNLDDAYLTDERAYDQDSARYADTFLIRSKALRQAEIERRTQIVETAKAALFKNGAGFTTIAREEDVVDKVIALFRQNGDERNL